VQLIDSKSGYSPSRRQICKEYASLTSRNAFHRTSTTWSCGFCYYLALPEMQSTVNGPTSAVNSCGHCLVVSLEPSVETDVRLEHCLEPNKEPEDWLNLSATNLSPRHTCLARSRAANLQEPEASVALPGSVVVEKFEGHVPGSGWSTVTRSSHPTRDCLLIAAPGRIFWTILIHHPDMRALCCGPSQTAAWPY